MCRNGIFLQKIQIPVTKAKEEIKQSIVKLNEEIISPFYLGKIDKAVLSFFTEDSNIVINITETTFITMKLAIF